VADYSDLIARLEKAKEAAQSAPMNKMYTDHKGHRFLGSHSTAWAVASREVSDITRALQSLEQKDAN